MARQNKSNNSSLSAEIVERLETEFGRKLNLKEIKSDDDIICIAYWDNGIRFTSCKKEEWEEIATDNADEAANRGDDGGFRMMYLDMHNNKFYRAVVKGVKFEEEDY